MTRHQAAEQYCLQRSWRLRSRPGDSRWLIGLAIEQLPDQPPQDFQRWREELEGHLGTAVRQKYGNPVVVWLLLNVVVPLVVKLVLEWWSNRKE